MRLISAVLLIAFSSGLLRAEEPLSLGGTSAWQVNYADDSCRLARRFGEGDDSVMLVLDRYEPGDFFRLTLIGERFSSARPNREVTIRFGPDAPAQNASFIKATTNHVPTILIEGFHRVVPDREEQDLAAVRYLTINAPRADPVRLETGALDEVFAVFDHCIDELLTHWGIDIEIHRTLSRPASPATPPSRWMGSGDYPRGLLARGYQGIVNFRLNIDAEGGVSQCHIQQSTRPEGFDRAVCDALSRRARFEPALDAAGNPVASYFVNSVRFEIPQ